MPKGPKITKEVERVIATVYKENNEWPAKQVGAEVNRRLREKNSAVPKNWPGLSSVQKYLTGIRQKESEIPDDPEDRYWSVITLAEYDIPPEALPIVLEIYVNNSEAQRAPLTIRQVKWIARLSHVVKDTEMLEFLSWMYAKNEDVNKLMGEVYLDISTDLFLYSKMIGQPMLFLSPGEDGATLVPSEHPREFHSWKQSSKPKIDSPFAQDENRELLIKIKEGIYARPYNKKIQE